MIRRNSSTIPKSRQSVSEIRADGNPCSFQTLRSAGELINRSAACPALNRPLTTVVPSAGTAIDLSDRLQVPVPGDAVVMIGFVQSATNRMQRSSIVANPISDGDEKRQWAVPVFSAGGKA